MTGSWQLEPDLSANPGRIAYLVMASHSLNSVSGCIRSLQSIGFCDNLVISAKNIIFIFDC